MEEQLRYGQNYIGKEFKELCQKKYGHTTFIKFLDEKQCAEMKVGMNNNTDFVVDKKFHCRHMEKVDAKYYCEVKIPDDTKVYMNYLGNAKADEIETSDIVMISNDDIASFIENKDLGDTIVSSYYQALSIKRDSIKLYKALDTIQFNGYEINEIVLTGKIEFLKHYFEKNRFNKGFSSFLRERLVRNEIDLYDNPDYFDRQKECLVYMHANGIKLCDSIKNKYDI